MKHKGDGVDLMPGVTVHVTIRRAGELRWRMWLGVRLMALAALVMNCNVKIRRIGW